MWIAPPMPVFALEQEGSSFTFGTDPTEALTRVEIQYEHADLQHHDVQDTATARFDVAFAERVALRFDVPFVHADPDDTQTETGLGDIRARIGWRAYEDPEFAVFFGGGIVLDSAEEDSLGSGQKQIVPFFSASGALPSIHSRLYETVEHFVSFDSDPERTGVALTKLDLHMMTQWSENTWTQAGGDFFVDWKGGEHTGLNLDLELGRNLGGGFAGFIRPGFGVFGEDVPGVVDWNVTVGLRWVF
jgi:hypothetical protein